MSSDDRVQTFLALVNRFIAIAEERSKRQMAGGDDVAPPGILEYLIKAMSNHREDALKGQLTPSRGVATLGILRTVSDWNEPFDSELLKAARDLEVYYVDEMK